MAFIKNKALYVLNDEGIYSPFHTVKNELFLTADRISGLFSFNEYRQAIRSPINKRTSRIYILNEDETIKRDISEYLVAGSVDMKHVSGQTRTANITLSNTKNEWKPSPTNDTFWKGTKFRIDTGIYFNGQVFWKKCGIFTPGDFTLDDNAMTISFQMYDKFSLIDGTVAGRATNDFKIARGTSIKLAIERCLAIDKGDGRPYDAKPIIFPSKYKDEVTPYTLTQSSGTSIGDLVIELATMIFCDVLYNDDGNLTVVDGLNAENVEYGAVNWYFADNELSYSNPNIVIGLSKVVNEIKVLGAIENGKQYKGIAQNTSAKSQTNIKFTPIMSQEISDNNIIGDDNCLNRAKYELKKLSMLNFQLNFKSVFIPHLLPNTMVFWSNKRHNIRNGKFVINTIRFDLVNNDGMELSLTNMEDIAIV